MRRNIAAVLLITALALFAGAGLAKAGTTLNPRMSAYVDELKKEAGVKEFSAKAGAGLYNAKSRHSVKGEDRSCSTCHTSDPAKSGKTKVGKVIEPMSPAVNKNRFTDPAKAEKWFKRNCMWVLERECTAAEKGDFITYMLSL